ncbi:hypothetical protein GF406_15155 [candidate division KSB1 bacterium]|nr:hypothetical protein [candidate division KSB1 bacterium]
MKNALWIVENDHLAATIKSLTPDGLVIAVEGGMIKWPDHTTRDLDPLSHPEFDPNNENLAAQLLDAAKRSPRVFIAFMPDMYGSAFFVAMQHFLGNVAKCHPVACESWTKANLKTNDPGFKHWKKASVVYTYFDELFNTRIGKNLVRLTDELHWLQAVALLLLKNKQRTVSQNVDPFTIQTTLKGKNCHSVLAHLQRFGEKPVRIRSVQEAKAIIVALKEQTPVVSALEKKESFQHPHPLLTTASLVELTEHLWQWTPQYTLDVAESLYLAQDKKGGLISFPYTQRSLIPETEHLEWRQLVFLDYGNDYLGDLNNRQDKRFFPWESQAIRPSRTALLNRQQRERLSDPQQRLYNLIRQKTIAAHIKPAVCTHQNTSIRAGDFLLTLSTLEYTRRGFLQVDQTSALATQSCPVVGLHEPLQWQNLSLDDHNHPTTFSAANLYAALFESGIHPQRPVKGLVESLMKNDLVDQNESGLFLTERGAVVTEHLQQFAGNLLTPSWAQEFEEHIRKVAMGRKKAETVLSILDKNIAKPDKDKLVSGNRVCPLCNAPLLVGNTFVQCQNYPEQCDYMQQVDPSRPQCPHCGKLLVVRKGKFGRFFACPGYPDCQHTEPFALGIKCPKPDCNGMIIERTGKSHKRFYGCSQFPGCEFILFEKPVDQSCSHCGYPLLVHKANGSPSDLVCPECNKVHIAQETRVA